MTDFNYRRLYDSMAPFYGALWEHIPPWYRYTQAVLPELPVGRALLEIGPGPGVLHEQLVERYPLVVGLDLSSGMLHKTQQRLRRARKPARLVCGDAVALPLAANTFDAVTMTFVFSAIPDGLAAMREFYRVLRPGGVLVMVDAGIPDDDNLPARVLARTWELFGDRMRDEAGLMEEVGFEVTRREQFGAFRGIRLLVGRK